jgi:hypothetical protein
MVNPSRISPTIRDILFTLVRNKTATVKDFAVIQQKRRALQSPTWGHSLVTSGRDGYGWRASLVHRGFIEVVGKTKSGAHVFALTEPGLELAISLALL